MVKHTQTVRRLLLRNCLNVFDPFVGLAPKGLIFFDILRKTSVSEPTLAFNLIKKETLKAKFSSEFCEIFKYNFFIEHLRPSAYGSS